jgi:uncharacterized RDD family membrane protein YckC
VSQPPLPPPPSPFPPAPGWAQTPEPIAAPAYAGFWIRVAASIIDSLVLSPLYIPLAIRVIDQLHITSSTDVSSIDFGQVSGELIGWALVLQFVRYVYELVMIGQWNATVGKFAVGIRVRQTDGSPATWRGPPCARAGARDRCVPAQPASCSMTCGCSGGGSSTLHDKIAGTIVVQK